MRGETVHSMNGTHKMTIDLQRQNKQQISSQFLYWYIPIFVLNPKRQPALASITHHRHPIHSKGLSHSYHVRQSSSFDLYSASEEPRSLLDLHDLPAVPAWARSV